MVNKTDDDRAQDLLRCKVKIYKLSNMQRCPYIYEMKERLLGEQVPVEVQPATKIPEPPPLIMDQQHHHFQQPVATVVKLNPDGYGSHTSPTHKRNDRTPLMPRDTEDDFLERNTHTYPKNAKTSLFIIMSFVYAKLLVVVCIAYVISDVVTHHIPLWYYEGFFTYLYGMSILFLLYVFCFLLQESSCCNGEKKEKAKSDKQKALKEKEKKKEEKEKKKEEEKKNKEKKAEKEKEKKKDKKGDKREVYPRKMRDVVQARALTPYEQSTYRRNSEGVVDAGLAGVPVPVAEIGAQSEHPVVLQEQTATNNSQSQQLAQDLEVGLKVVKRKRKTTQNDQSHGSFFLRIGAIAFGLGTMIYNGLECGSFFEIPFTSPCYMILRGVNPVLQMVFTFMQMYFIFMNSRLNIHRFKVIARFGLMHIVATNICVWIRTVVLEYLKEITIYHKKFNNFPDSIRLHNLRNANTVLGTHVGVPDAMLTSTTTEASTTTASTIMAKALTTLTTAATTNVPTTMIPTTIPTIPSRVFTTASTTTTTTLANLWRSYRASPTPFPTTTTSTTTLPTTTTTLPTTTTTKIWTTITTTLASTPLNNFFGFNKGFESFESNVANVVEDASNSMVEEGMGGINGSELLENILPQALLGLNGTEIANNSILQASCGRVNIMGTIVQDSAPYLFPFIIEYSLIGAAVIYVIWKHIGRNPRYYSDEDLEHRLEVMLSRRAVAMAHAQNGRVDCVGASKGLFFGLLLLVGSLICLILFFVMIHHRDLSILAMYLADVSHCGLMALSIIAIIVGFIRVQSLKFKVEEQSDLNDILLRVSAFGLFIYAVFTVIAGSLSDYTREPNLLVMLTGILAVVQVVLQLLFIADVSRRRVHLPEHDRSKPGRQIVTFLLICNITMWIIYTFEAQKVEANPIQLEFYGFLAWSFIQRLTLPLCIFHRFHSAVTLAEIWKTSYKARLE